MSRGLGDVYKRHGKNRELAGPTAPARGLALVEINYEKTVDTN